MPHKMMLWKTGYSVMFDKQLIKTRRKDAQNGLSIGACGCLNFRGK